MKSQDNRITFFRKNRLAGRIALLVFFCVLTASWKNTSAQTEPAAQISTSPQQTASPRPSPTPLTADRNESERSDRLTGGRIEVADLEPNQPDIRITLNVPSFRLTFWQNGKEVKSYYIGVGMKEHPLYIGDREATEIIWNPPWIPPDSDWVSEIKSVQPGEIIKAGDPRNPLGKMKIPLGSHYLIHQAAKLSDVGNLVSHGCVRMPRSDLYDLADKIIAARGLKVSRKRIEAAKRSSKMLVVRLQEPLPVDINYDTLVVEDGVLHIYSDVYSRGTNRPSRLRAELQDSNVDVSNLSEATIKQMLRKVSRRTQFVVDTRSIAEGRALEDGRVVPLIPKRSGK